MHDFPRTESVIAILQAGYKLPQNIDPQAAYELLEELRKLLDLVPEQKLRSYKGVTYENNGWYYCGSKYDSVSRVIALANLHVYSKEVFTDDDFTLIMDLKNNPYEDLAPINKCTVDAFSTEELLEEVRRRGLKFLI